VMYPTRALTINAIGISSARVNTARRLVPAYQL
jgi:hypothetical protein